MYYQIFKDDAAHSDAGAYRMKKLSAASPQVIKQEPIANKEFCKIVQELAQKNSHMPPPSLAISELLERSALLELRFEAGGCGQLTN